MVTIFNVFITYGDTFLPSASSYDELYYELVRCHQTFDNLYSMALRYSTVSNSTVNELITTRLNIQTDSLPILLFSVEGNTRTQQ